MLVIITSHIYTCRMEEVDHSAVPESLPTLIADKTEGGGGSKREQELTVENAQLQARVSALVKVSATHTVTVGCLTSKSVIFHLNGLFMYFCLCSIVVYVHVVHMNYMCSIVVYVHVVHMNYMCSIVVYVHVVHMNYMCSIVVYVHVVHMNYMCAYIAHTINAICNVPHKQRYTPRTAFSFFKEKTALGGIRTHDTTL